MHKHKCAQKDLVSVFFDVTLAFFSESDEDVSLQVLAKRQEAKEKSERGCGFLRRKWTITEILTTSALYFEVFGWVSTFVHSLFQL